MQKRDRAGPFGSYYGSTIVAASFVIQGTIVGAIFTYGVFFDALHTEFGWSRTVISAGSSLTSLVMGLSAMIFGGLTDATGPRRILAVAAVTLSTGYLLMSRMNAPWHLLVAYPLFVGVAFGTHDVITLSAVARWFGRRRGRMSAIVKTGTGTGQVIGPVVAAALIAVLGWRTAYVWIAVVTGPLVFVASRFMRRSPSDMGMAHEDPVRDRAPEQSRVRDLMRRPEFVRICIAQAAFFFCAPVVIVHSVAYATDLGIERAVAAGVLSVIGGISIAGRLVIGAVIDRVGGRIALLVCYAIMFVAFVLLQLAVNAPLLYLFAIVYGFAHGAVFTAVSPLVAEYFGTRAHGLLYGTIVFVGTIAGAVGPVFAGVSFDLLGTYRPVFAVMLALAVVAAISIGSIRPRVRGIV
ncbi:MAG: MFS transporter [Spirochaetaceae bacterium]|nr:MAG: MFS transporter [Spirochaetaceae bacterium]